MQVSIYRKKSENLREKINGNMITENQGIDEAWTKIKTNLIDSATESIWVREISTNKEIYSIDLQVNWRY